MKWVALILISGVLGISWRGLGADGVDDQRWKSQIARIPIAYGGRIMAMDSYARLVGVEISGRADGLTLDDEHGTDHIDFLMALLFKAEVLLDEPIIPVKSRSLKFMLGMEAGRKWFSGVELMANARMYEISSEIQARALADPGYSLTDDELAVMEIQRRLSTIAFFVNGSGLAIVPIDDGLMMARAGLVEYDPECVWVHTALLRLQDAYRRGEDLEDATEGLILSLESVGGYRIGLKDRIRVEVLSNQHGSWRLAMVGLVLALLFFAADGVSRSRVLRSTAWVCMAWALGEFSLGFLLRGFYLERVPVANTYEVILWIGYVAIVVGILGHLVSTKSWLLYSGLVIGAAALFASRLVPIGDRITPLTPALRSDLWLGLHVLTIVGGYGIMLVAAGLGHVYLVRVELLGRYDEQLKLIIPVYRTMGLGSLLLAMGTLLGGVWAADSWGRFWGWDPKETWSLISLLIFVAFIHARLAGWIHDTGLAIGSIVGFSSLMWTFYGVNYLVGQGLHSYGFGEGGAFWFGVWLIFEILFVQVCFTMGPTRIDEEGSDISGDMSEP